MAEGSNPSAGTKYENIMVKAEGRLFEFDSEDKIRPELLETFEFDSPNQHIKTETDEFSAVCPFSGLPDLAYVQIEYYPEGGKCVELKSLKYYFISFRNVGIYQEAVTKRIYEDLKSVLETEKLIVTTMYNTRGGFDTTCAEGSID
ncbi:MAG TPA: NADPH-dependent 7-cyano-7-deazaguanine reductase QueF [Candidatus Marinimicrobia bacterium]|nr:NADPH-dependent 7-cyano-7-deazaguanine reductase QueF [Candidatus Neomarinimicrobiota bacterium]